MPVSFQTVRTLNGLKNRAEALAAEHSLGHMKSLDLASQELGYSGYKKAQQNLPAKMVTIQVKVRWHDTRYKLRGTESISYPFMQPLAQMLSPAKGRRRQRLGMFVMTDENLLELELQLEMPTGAQTEARRKACQTIRRLMFMEALGVTLAPPNVIGWSIGPGTNRVDNEVRMPGTDHHSVWVTQECAVLIVDEPYLNSDGQRPKMDRQLAWCDENGFEMAFPAWKGMWNPEGGTHMSLLARKDSGLDLQEMAEKLVNLPDDFGQKEWRGSSTSR
jgi:hypothetical protein